MTVPPSSTTTLEACRQLTETRDVVSRPVRRTTQ